MSAEQCISFCNQWTTCGECAAYPQCGWCGAAGTGGASGGCVPAMREEDHATRPDRMCADGEWFYRTNDLSIPPGTPGFCPPPAPETTGGGEAPVMDETATTDASGGAS